AVVELDREIAAAGTNSARLAPIATRLMALLRDAQTTPAARQAIAQRLVVFPEAILTSGNNPALFAAMFADDQQVNFARLALDLAPGKGIVDTLYLNALKAASPSTRLAIVQSVGRRRIAKAVPLLAPLLKEEDVALVTSTLHALQSIGTKEALAAVSTAPRPNSPDVIEAALSIAYQIGGAQATRTFQTISENSSAPAHLRAAGYRGLLFAEPAAAPARFVTALAGSDVTLKPVVIEAIASHPSKTLVSALTAQLANWDAPTQASVIAALGRRNDVAAVPAISAATQHEDAEVRTAALTALGHLPGNRDVALLLAQVAAGKNPEEAKLASLGLARLNGPGVADLVLKEATQGTQPTREVFVQQLAARNVVSSIPHLLKMRDDPAPAVRSAALSSLAEIASPSEQRAVLDWTVHATNATEQSRAVRALATITLRNPNVEERSAPIIDAIKSASPAVALRLLPVLPRISGNASAQSAARLALHQDESVSIAAINTLSRWNDQAGLIPLVEVSEKATNDRARSAATSGVVRYLERSRDIPSADLVSVIARVAPVTREIETKERLVYLLGRSAGPNGLALAEKLQSDSTLTSVATDAAAIIRAKSAGKPAIRASSNESQIQNIVDEKPQSRWVVPARPDQWIEVDYKITRPFRQIVLDNNGATWGSPEEFAVFVTDDPKNPGEPRVTGSGQTGKTTIDLPANTRGRYLIVRHTGNSDDSVWAISELIVD
ncbi:MAG TPA: HEAT repeat domain-containing protein, partial [Opitutus sp.]|nr:HEAT repeat domain-containing protein [Opitutus sp.]